MVVAVLALIDSKYGHNGIFRNAHSNGAWRDPAVVRAGIPQYSEAAVEAAIAYCTYVYERYGRFPAVSGPFRTALAYQASRLDRSFYERFYEPGVLP